MYNFAAYEHWCPSNEQKDLCFYIYLYIIIYATLFFVFCYFLYYYLY